MYIVRKRKEKRKKKHLRRRSRRKRETEPSSSSSWWCRGKAPLVPYLEETIPRASGNGHTILGNAQTTNTIIMAS